MKFIYKYNDNNFELLYIVRDDVLPEYDDID